ncbi:MAG: flagellar basal-body MS-ring/collar protein FliF [bacterium]|nr:flagellar basal-body MS-ring/collar protein FliF [bacterium]
MRARQIFESISYGIRRIPLPFLIGAAALFLALGIGITFIYLSRTKEPEIKWGILYTDLKSQDLSRIVDELERMKVPYKVSEAADSIFIPQELIPEIRNTLAQKGLPQERAGLEIFDTPRFGMTDFMQRVNYQRAIQGELERTIAKIQCVENVRIHIAFPEKKLFTEQEKDPTASVMLWITPGCSMPAGSVKGIVHLVSSSIEGLKPENVTVVDQRGRILAPRKQEEEELMHVEASEAQIQLKRKFERDLEERLTELLEKSVGEGRVAVKVDAELDFTKVKRVSERYDPFETAVRSEQTIQERFKGVGAVPVGPPGTRENVPPDIGIEPLPGKSEYERDERIRNYEISKIVEHVEEEVGDIKRISVAVMVDGQYEVERQDNKPYVKFIPLPDTQLEGIRSFVVSAVGIRQERGDQVSVVSVPFEGSFRYAERLAMFELSELSKERASMYQWLAIAAIGFFISLYLIFKKLFERRLPQEVEVVIPKFEKQPPEKIEIPVAFEVPPPPTPVTPIEITPPQPIEIKVEELAPPPPPPEIRIIPPPPVEIPEYKPPPPPPKEEVIVEEIKPPPEEVKPVEEVKPPPVEVKPPEVIEVKPVEEVKPEEVVIEEIKIPEIPREEVKPPPPPPEEFPQIKIAPPPTFELPSIEIAAPPPLPEEDIETITSVARDIVSTNKDVAILVIRKWLQEK